MKLLHTICAALMMVAITSCDEHREFPDTAMRRHEESGETAYCRGVSYQPE